MTDGLRPTDEQARILDLFATGRPLAVEAGAGTGKTTTLQMIAAAMNGRTGQYVAFNRSIVQEAGAKMPGNVRSNTAHSLAMRAVGWRYRHRLESERMKSWRIARLLDVNDLDVKLQDGRSKRLSGSYLASLAMRAVNVFCQTADPEPTWEHVPEIRGVDVGTDPLGRRRTDNQQAVARALEPVLRRAWADLTDPDGDLPFRHDHYLKLWQLGRPRIPADVILFDEAQDANPVLADAIAQQDAQVVWVGDSNQQIYAWRGAINALANVNGDRAYLSQSWRFGQQVADVANSILAELASMLRLTGNPRLDSVATARIERPRAILCRSNATSLVRVMGAQAAGRKVHLVGDGTEIVRFAEAAERLQAREPANHPDLACFESWPEVQAYVADDPQGDELRLLVELVDEFGVPTIRKALDSGVSERQADVVVSTAHKAKGREWRTVQLADDFPDSDDPQQPLDDEELRLLYVATTRAELGLDAHQVTKLTPVLDWLRQRTETR